MISKKNDTCIEINDGGRKRQEGGVGGGWGYNIDRLRILKYSYVG